MLYLPYIIYHLELLLIFVPILLIVAYIAFVCLALVYITLVERKPKALALKGTFYPPKSHLFINKSLESSIFNNSKLNNFFNILMIRLIKYILLILPCILISKSIYTCWYDNIWSLSYFKIHLIQSIPFIGSYLNSYILNSYDLSSNTLELNSYISDLLFIGGISGSLAWSLHDVFYPNLFSLSKMAIGENIPKDMSNLPLCANSENNGGGNIYYASLEGAKNEGNISDKPELSSDNREYSTKAEIGKISAIEAELMAKDANSLNESALIIADKLKSLKVLPLDGYQLNPQSATLLVDLLMQQGSYISMYFTNRFMWINGYRGHLRGCLLESVKQELEISSNKANIIREKYWSSIDHIKGIKDPQVQVREFFAAINTYRNGIYKEINKSESLILDALRKDPVYKFPALKTALNEPFFQAKKEFNTHDGYLKAKVGEILNRKKS